MRDTLTISLILSMLVLLGTAGAVRAQGDPLADELARMNALTKSGNEKLRNNDIDGALKDFNEALLAAEPFPGNIKSAAYLSRARALQRKGDLDTALADLDKAIRLQSSNVFAYQNRGHLQRERKEYDKAVADYTMVIKLNPKFYYAYRDRGLALVQAGKDPEAEKDFAKYRELFPDGAAGLEKDIENVKAKRSKP